MTSSYFEQLTETRQTDVIWECGVYLDRRKEGYYNILLFQVADFYTEIFYHAHFNVIIKIVSFSDTDLLATYLEKIKLQTLFPDQ